jgi:hypothetical protein
MRPIDLRKIVAERRPQPPEGGENRPGAFRFRCQRRYSHQPFQAQGRQAGDGFHFLPEGTPEAGLVLPIPQIETILAFLTGYIAFKQHRQRRLCRRIEVSIQFLRQMEAVH